MPRLSIEERRPPSGGLLLEPLIYDGGICEMSGTLCYHKNMSGREAAVLLRKVGEDGSFLVRDSESVAGVFVLTLLYQSLVLHYRILTAEDGRLYAQLVSLREKNRKFSKPLGNLASNIGDERVLFNDINEIVEWFKQRGGSNGLACALKHPVPVENTEAVEIQISEDEDVHDYEDLSDYEASDKNQEIWYHENISRLQAEELLMEAGKDGSFLVRNSESLSGAYVLCLLNHSKVHQYRILTDQDGRLYVESHESVESLRFTDLNKLIKTHQQLEYCNGLASALKYPIPYKNTEASGADTNEEDDSFKDLPDDEACRDRSAPNIQSGLCPGPSVWSTGSALSQDDFADHYAVIKVEETSDEFIVVTDLFYESLPRDVKIISLERVENGELWISFDTQRTKMKRKARRTGTFKELSLFHGTTSDMIGAICRQGFDFRLSGIRIGHRFGKGSYFAKDAKYSDNYADKTDKNMKMFLARVLVGEYIEGDNQYVRPPAKSSENPHDLYDSCVDDVTDPKIFVVFSLEQAYPEYIITYEGCTDIGYPDPDGVDVVL